jgi:hypothetical protein
MGNIVIDKIDAYMDKKLNKNIKEEEDKKSDAYKAYFKKMLKKYGVDEPDKIPDKDKKKFYDEVDKGWKADKETD